MRYKTIIGICILSLLFLSGCHKEIDEENIKRTMKLYFLDCTREVVCYDRGLHVAAVSCVHVPELIDCKFQQITP